MTSGFRTFLYAIGLGSACYLLTAASWTQVLFLFLAASIGWVIYTVKPPMAGRPSFAAFADAYLAEPRFESPRNGLALEGFESVSQYSESETETSVIQQKGNRTRRQTVSNRSTQSTTKFPIHKLGRAIPLVEM